MQPPKPNPRRPNWPHSVASVSTSTARAMVVGFGLIAACAGGLVLWSATAPIASAVVANGQVVVASKRRQIQHPTGGVIRALRVVDGNVVEAGAPLIELENADAAERYTRTRDTFYLALAMEARLQAEAFEQDEPAFPTELLAAAAKEPSVKAIVDGQKQLFGVRRVEIYGQLSILKEQNEQLKNELNGIVAERRSSDQQLTMTRNELGVVDDLFERGYTTRTRVFSLRREIAQLSGGSARMSAMGARTKSAIIESDLKLLQAKNQLQTQIQGDLRETQAKIPNLREQFRAAVLAYDHMTIRAPVAGTVIASRVNTLGSVVRPGETILEIVPQADRLMVEVQLSPIDVDSVTVGLKTEVQLTGLNQRTSVPLEGRITHISADALQDARTSATYFIAHVDVPDRELRKLGQNQLQPGMPAAVMIKTGERTALAYLTQPLTDSINRAWREQ